MHRNGQEEMEENNGNTITFTTEIEVDAEGTIVRQSNDVKVFTVFTVFTVFPGVRARLKSI